MTRTVVARYSGMLAIITAYIAVVPGLAFAQKFEYRDVIKTLEVKSPPRRNAETKPAETMNAETKPATTNGVEIKAAEAKYVEPKAAKARYESKPTIKNVLPTVDWLHTRWHMSMGQVAGISPNIVPTTTAERRDHTNPDIGIALLKEQYVEERIQYTAFYWFYDNKLVAVALKPSDFRHWPKVNMGLEQTYGKPTEDKSKTSVNEGMQCVVTDRKWISERQGTAISFLAQDCNQSPPRHWNFYSVQYEPVSTTSKIGLQAARF